MKYIGYIILIMFTATCKKVDDKSLCDCMHSNDPNWDMHISKECQTMIIDKFGNKLDGMEEWFEKNCKKIKRKTQIAGIKEKKSKTN